MQVRSVLTHDVSFVTLLVHPWAMLILGVWLLWMALAILLQRLLPRWSFEGLGLWFGLRLSLEFLIINLLIFAPRLVAPGVLLGQIVLYLPFFIFWWGWFFHRLDWFGRSTAGQVLQLIDAHEVAGLSRFDDFVSAINSLLSKGRPTIIAISGTGRIAVLIHNGMALTLDAVAVAPVPQLTKAAV